jgi:hypothetical protein
MNIHSHSINDEFDVTIKDWGTYVAVNITFAGHDITFYPETPSEGITVAEQIRSILTAMAAPTMRVMRPN